MDCGSVSDDSCMAYLMADSPDNRDNYERYESSFPGSDREDTICSILRRDCHGSAIKRSFWPPFTMWGALPPDSQARFYPVPGSRSRMVLELRDGVHVLALHIVEVVVVIRDDE
jgi:hypothetical protein